MELQFLLRDDGKMRRRRSRGLNADRRLTQLALQPMYRIPANPLPWMDAMLSGVEHANFFESRATEYSRASTLGTWDEAFD